MNDQAVHYDPLLPWHRQLFEQLCALHAQQRLGHGWLLHGLPGSGKLWLARHLARFLLCQQSLQGQPCGACSSCHLFGRGTHPDFRLLQIAPDKQQISIEQVRDGIEFALNTSQRGGMKILVIAPAEAMTLNAANSLLKLLEEPPAQTLLLLLSEQPGLLLPTLRSRCQTLRCPLPDPGEAAAWLQAQGFTGNTEAALRRAGGAPLRALVEADPEVQAAHRVFLDCLQALLEDREQVSAAAKKCEKSSIIAHIDFLLRSLADLLGNRQAAQPLRDAELAPLATLLRDCEVARLHRFYQQAMQSRKVALASNNANPQLLLEGLLAQWRQLAARSGGRPRNPMQQARQDSVAGTRQRTR